MRLSNAASFDVFEQRKKLQDVWRSIRRLVDKYAPNHTTMGGRKFKRCSRCLPALLASWKNGKITGGPYWGITKDFSDNGMALVLPEPLEAEDVVCGLWTGSPVFLAGIVREMQPFGGNFWLASLEFVERVESCRVSSLLPFAEQLVPSTPTSSNSRSLIGALDPTYLPTR